MPIATSLQLERGVCDVETFPRIEGLQQRDSMIVKFRLGTSDF